MHHGSDSYFSINPTLVDPSLLIGNIYDRFENNSIKYWNLKNADWIEFGNLCSETILVENFENLADPIKRFTDTLTSIAYKCIPKTSTIPKELKTLGLQMSAKKR